MHQIPGYKLSTTHQRNVRREKCGQRLPITMETIVWQIANATKESIDQVSTYVIINMQYKLTDLCFVTTQNVLAQDINQPNPQEVQLENLYLTGFLMKGSTIHPCLVSIL